MIPNLSERTYLITGATSGIGLALMKGLAAKETGLIGIGRSPDLCQKVEVELQEGNPSSWIRYLVADLSRQDQIRKAAAEVKTLLEERPGAGLDGLVNNAGTFTFWQTFTPEGFETQWAVNHLAPFLLTNLLLPVLETTGQARVITISSGSHYGARLNWNDIQGLGRYNPLKAYKRTKLANVLFTAELRRRLGPDSSIQVFAADPGLVNTGMGEKNPSLMAREIWKRRRLKGITPEQTAEGIIQLLLGSDRQEGEGIYWKHGKPQKPNPYSLDPDHGWRLWEISARMTGLA
jgi:NAD(P)-dependent dehydrogenase (short-subunit alcohol dehydrogenase family)